jgi:hypothetical protein
MKPDERDDLRHAITQTLAFYDKTLDALQMKFWLRAFSDRSLADVKRALMEYTASGRYAPKPVQILDLIDDHLEQQRRTESLATPALPESFQEAPPNVARAWAFAIKLWHIGDLVPSVRTDLSDDEIEQALLLVNRQAQSSGTPTAIPPDAWLPDLWGCSRDEAVRRAAA